VRPATINSRALAVFGYCLPALVSGILLSGLSFAGDLASALAFTVAQALLVRSLRWTIVTGVGFLVGWSAGTGAAAIAGLGVVVVHGLVTHAPLSDADVSQVLFPVAGLVGGAVTGAIAGALQLAGGRRLPRLRWVVTNCAGGALTGIPLLYAFTTHNNLVAMVAVFGACAVAGLIWGALVARLQPLPPGAAVGT
jgi:hypothetical protein